MFFLLNEKEFLGSKDSINLQEEKHHTEKKEAKEPFGEPMDALAHRMQYCLHLNCAW